MTTGSPAVLVARLQSADSGTLPAAAFVQGVRVGFDEGTMAGYTLDQLLDTVQLLGCDVDALPPTPAGRTPWRRWALATIRQQRASLANPAPPVHGVPKAGAADPEVPGAGAASPAGAAGAGAAGVAGAARLGCMYHVTI